MGLAAFLCSLAVMLFTMLVWPGGAPLAVPIIGVLVALLAGLLLPWAGRRNPYFRNREDVERLLDLPVLATCPPRRKR